MFYHVKSLANCEGHKQYLLPKYLSLVVVFPSLLEMIILQTLQVALLSQFFLCAMIVFIWAVTTCPHGQKELVSSEEYGSNGLDKPVLNPIPVVDYGFMAIKYMYLI